MGHEHADLAKRLQRGPVAMVPPSDPAARRAWRDIMEILFSPQEAALAARLPVLPTAVAPLARRLRMDPARLRRQLDGMADKGLVLDLPRQDGATLYLLAPPVVGFFELSMMRFRDGLPKARLARAYRAYMEDDREFLATVAAGKTRLGRALVTEPALPGDLVSEVLDWERASSCVESAEALAVTNCFCRHAALHLGTACSRPLETCMSLGPAAAYLVRHDLGRRISIEEGLELLTAARESGLVHIADNVRQDLMYICSCCSCCCVELRSVQLGASVVQPSGFRPVVHERRCTGCGGCVRACPVQAVTLTPRQSGDDDARSRKGLCVDHERCLGCGLCAQACRERALAMERDPDPFHIPLNPIEYLARRMLERGCLADLIIDGTAGRGPAFANAILRALFDLPPARRLLAAERLHSRCVQFALAHYRLPRGV